MHVYVDVANNPDPNSVGRIPLLHGVLLDQHGHAGADSWRAHRLFQTQSNQRQQRFELFVENIDRLCSERGFLLPDPACVTPDDG